MKLLTYPVILAFCVLIVVLSLTMFFVGKVKEVRDGLDYLLTRYREVRSEVVLPDGKNVRLRNSIIFRIPEEQGSESRFNTLNEWLTVELGGYSRWRSESQTITTANTAGSKEQRWVYLVGISYKAPTNSVDLIKDKVASVFPEHRSLLMISLPGPVSTDIP